MSRDTSNCSQGFADLAEDTLVDLAGQNMTAPTTPVRKSIYIMEADIKNNSGSDATVGYGYKLLNADWKAGQWDDSESGVEYTDDTTDAQDAGTDDFALTTTTNNDGFVVQFTKRAGAYVVGITVSTAEAGSPAYEYAYWNGTAYSTFTPLVTPDFTGTGDTALVFSLPSDAALGAEDSDKYAIRVRATTAPSTAPLATKIWVSALVDYIGTLADGTSLSMAKGGLSGGKKIPPGYSMVAYSSVADMMNQIDVDYVYVC